MTPPRQRKPAPNTTMVRPGEVRAIRELRTGVQAQVCIAASARHGSAVLTVQANSPAVRRALATLKREIANETKVLLGDILQGQKEWDSRE